jgi:hypothetical protein
MRGCPATALVPVESLASLIGNSGYRSLDTFIIYT